MEAELLLTFQTSACLRLPGLLDPLARAILSGSYSLMVRRFFAPITSISHCRNACGKAEGWLAWFTAWLPICVEGEREGERANL